jgi:alpha-galactosidase
MPFHRKVAPITTASPTLRRAIALLLCAAFIPGAALAADAKTDPLSPSGEFSVYKSDAAQTPPMGWNPWNAFRTDVDEAKIRGSAQALVDTGLAAHGYRYVNIDDGWALKRLPDGRIRIRESMFPSAAIKDSVTGSFLPFTSFIHGLGLKAGLYTDIGRNTCAQRWDAESPNLPVGTRAEREVGSFGHADSDLRTVFRDWKFDYVKIDACGVADYARDVEPVTSGRYAEFKPYIVRSEIPQSNPAAVEALYARLGDAVRTWGGSKAVLSICAWGEALSPRWANRRGNLWRTSPDIEFNWKSMLFNIDSIVGTELYAGPGHWNDPDMLAIGHGDFDANHLTEARAHMTMWAVFSAPLLLGYDLRKSPQSLIDIVGNSEVIAIDQDALGNQGVVHRFGTTMVVVRTLEGTGARAVALFNPGDKPATSQVDWTQLGYAPGTIASVRDIWAKQDRTGEKDAITVSLKPHEAVLLRLSGTPVDPDAVWLDEMPGRINVATDGVGNRALPAGTTPARVAMAPDGTPIKAGSQSFSKGIGVFANSRLELRADRGFRRFVAIPVALNSKTAVRFRVYSDRKLVSDVTRLPGAPVAPINVNITHGRIVELVVTSPSGSGTTPMAAWADAKLVR